MKRWSPVNRWFLWFSKRRSLYSMLSFFAWRQEWTWQLHALTILVQGFPHVILWKGVKNRFWDCHFGTGTAWFTHKIETSNTHNIKSLSSNYHGVPFVNTAEPPRFSQAPKRGRLLYTNVNVCPVLGIFWMFLVCFSCGTYHYWCEASRALDHTGPSSAIDAKRIACPAQMLGLNSLVAPMADGRKKIKKEPLLPQIWPCRKH